MREVLCPVVVGRDEELGCPRAEPRGGGAAAAGSCCWSGRRPSRHRRLQEARERLPEGVFRVGELEELPWDAGTFDAVTAFNSIQYATDPKAALAELHRVARPAASVAVVVWAALERNDAKAFMAAIGSLLPPPPPGAAGPFALSVPGVLEELLASAGLEPAAAGEVPTPFEFADLEAAWRSVAACGPGTRAIREASEERARATVTASFAPFRQPDGRYRLENAFCYAVAHA